MERVYEIVQCENRIGFFANGKFVDLNNKDAPVAFLFTEPHKITVSGKEICIPKNQYILYKHTAKSTNRFYIDFKGRLYCPTISKLIGAKLMVTENRPMISVLYDDLPIDTFLLVRRFHKIAILTESGQKMLLKDGAKFRVVRRFRYIDELNIAAILLPNTIVTLQQKDFGYDMVSKHAAFWEFEYITQTDEQVRRHVLPLHKAVSLKLAKI